MQSGNLLLDSLPEAIRSSLLARCRPVRLPLRHVLFEAGEYPPRFIHFLTAGIASVVTELADGGTVEVGLVGAEGLAECHHLLGPNPSVTRCFMQVPGEGFRMSFALFESEFMHQPAVRRLVLRYVQYSSQILSQLVACNRLHEVEPRLARWLLMAQDKIHGPNVQLTQEFLAQMLGSRRSTVTVTAGILQRAGLIEYRRGRVNIVDRVGLESAACECYSVTKRLYQTLYT